ncbi:NAD(P)H-binding protein [Sphingomonas sp. PAMC 26621]|uniref:NAD(P)H-binding protein n=1 Tax=Sphingomonas sp. PAMC 26621 TaxID=1112213 RepID=UPI0009DA04F2
MGSRVLAQLLDRGEKVRVISHNPDKLSKHALEQCEVIAGSLDNVDDLKRGFQGAKSVF